jgi:hypothetical protein
MSSLRQDYKRAPVLRQSCTDWAGFGRIPPESVPHWQAKKGSTKPFKADLRHLRGHRRDPAARDRASDQRDAHPIRRFSFGTRPGDRCDEHDARSERVFTQAYTPAHKGLKQQPARSSAITKLERCRSADTKRSWRPALRTDSRTGSYRRPDRAGHRTRAHARRRCREAPGGTPARRWRWTWARSLACALRWPGAWAGAGASAARKGGIGGDAGSWSCTSNNSAHG